jgi:hypothetical protein
MALALEEMGIYNYHNNLFDQSDHLPPVKGKYIMITGRSQLTSGEETDLRVATSQANMYGEKIKVILINIAGSEGVDLKYIRQVHIMDPWYNTNRLDQIIGRAVRSYSHHDLKFQYRNVEIFLYGTIIPNDPREPIDLYIYRQAEHKSIKMGRVTRLLKQGAIDCTINKSQQDLTHETLSKYGLGTVAQITSGRKHIPNVNIGDMPYSSNCDFMESCEYACIPDDDSHKIFTDLSSIDKHHIFIGIEGLMYTIETYYLTSYYYTFDELFAKLNKGGIYSKEQVYYALTKLIDEKVRLTDSQGNTGTLINLGDYYIFQPINLNDPSISYFDRTHTMPNVIDHLKINVKGTTKSTQSDVPTMSISDLLDIIDTELISIKEASVSIDRVSPTATEFEKLYSYMGTSMYISAIVFRQLGDRYASEKADALAVSIYIDRLAYTSKLLLIQAVIDKTIDNRMPEYYTQFIIDHINEQYIYTHGGLRFIVLFEYDVISNLHIRKTFLISDTVLVPINTDMDYDTMQVIEEGILVKEKQIKKNISRVSVMGFLECKGNPPVFEFRIKDLKNKRSAGRVCSTILMSNIYNYIPQRITNVLNQTVFETEKLPKDYLCMLTLFILAYLKQYVSYEHYEIIFNKNE